ncbi:MAG TPA: hypothetical protein VFT99_20600 [Roseiflexaceae bacterium]|nr:hypothetical protein [Roseiflexaceae bacterium]
MARRPSCEKSSRMFRENRMRRLLMTLCLLLILTPATPATAEPAAAGFHILIAHWTGIGSAHIAWSHQDSRACLYRVRHNWPTVSLPGACGSDVDVYITQGTYLVEQFDGSTFAGVMPVPEHAGNPELQNDIQYQPIGGDTFYLAVDERFPGDRATLPMFTTHFPLVAN